MSKRLLYLAIVSIAISSGCAVEASKKTAAETKLGKSESSASSAPKGPTIDIQPNSPADTVRVFYKDLREKRFRDALYLTDLRPAIEGLTDAELKEFQLDFEKVSLQVPEVLQINGEIVSGDVATVTAKLPKDDSDKLEIQEVKLRRESGVWIILTTDEAAQKKIKAEGKNYFFQLRIETHEDEAREMLKRISSAQLAYSLTHGNQYGEIPALVEAGFLPEDVQTSDSTGYKYDLKLTDDKRKYSVSAVPSEYGKTGKLSFAVRMDGKGSPRLTSKDLGGKPLNN